MGKPPTSYVLQTFGVDFAKVDVWDAITGLYASEVMQGLQNYPEDPSDSGAMDSFREHSFTKVSYTGTNNRDTDGYMIFKGSEEHTAKWVEEDDTVDGLVWL
jgi:hypothetical protein